MSNNLFFIPGSWPGRLVIVPRPRGGEWLEDEVRAWQNAEVDIVASLLTPQEISELNLESEAEWLQVYGIEYRSYPIPDRGVPASRSDFTDFMAKLEHALESHQTVAVHCRQGIGRSGLVAAALLISAGEEPEAAWKSIEQARDRPIPDTEEQREWVNTFQRLGIIGP